MNLSRVSVAVLAASLALALAACNKPGSETAKPAAEAAAGAPATTIAGLPTQKDQDSYMVGMALGKQLEPMKDDIDLDVVTKAIRSTFKGEKLLMTEQQAMQAGESFGQRMQAKAIAKMMAEAKKNADAGQAFLAQNAKKPGVQTTASGLQYQVISEGKGPKPTASDTVKVNYKGTLLDGKVFDDSAQHGGPAEIPLQAVVPGWREGVTLMPVGSKYRFWIPGNLGYGDKVPPGAPIGPNALLVFDVELLDIVQPGAQPQAQPVPQPGK
jgi:FKBP-type peptidyl-prolyl cis-trans isomerase FkpA